jgi:hypothetical protein
MYDMSFHVGRKEDFPAFIVQDEVWCDKTIGLGEEGQDIGRMPERRDDKGNVGFYQGVLEMNDVPSELGEVHSVMLDSVGGSVYQSPSFFYALLYGDFSFAVGLTYGIKAFLAGSEMLHDFQAYIVLG